ncbi:hypothetical protein [Azospirillum sp.]|uniref:hypothetical protein n=1 Tax=Azospirillum sp. TaxID=34012 RepID=UPI002601CC2D|nr:hypothetical protein [Azospirillum sp.]
MSDGVSSVSQMVSDLNKSLKAAIANVQSQQQAQTPAAEVKSYEKQVRKSSSDSRMFATDIGVLSKNVSRLNVVGTLAPNDPVDFYKFRVTSKGEATMGQIGDQGVQVQLMSKTGQVVADSNKNAGKAYESFRSLQRGQLSLDQGDYTVRVTRDKGESAKDPKNYAIQFSMGGYSQDYDTVAKAPRKGDSPFQMTQAQQQMMDGLNSAISSMNSIPTGQTGTQKLMGSFSLFA